MFFLLLVGLVLLDILANQAKTIKWVYTKVKDLFKTNP